MATKRIGARMSGFLSRIGSGISKAVTSSTARRIATAAGTAISKAASSEIGQRAISGAIEGAVNSALTGEALGESMKRAVILNVAGVHQTVPDPLNAAEIETQVKLRELEQENKREEAAIRHNAIMLKREGDVLKNVKHLQKLQAITENEEQNEIKDLDAVLETTRTLVREERTKLDKVAGALVREDMLRTADERKLIEGMRHNYQALAKNVEAERSALIEEAIEQTVDIGGEIAEHATASIPFVGEAVASGMATARGAIQIYRLGKTIHALTGLHTHHMEVPSIHQGAIETLLTSEHPTSDASLARIAGSRSKHLKEIEAEVSHLQKEVVPAYKKVCQSVRRTAPEHLRKQCEVVRTTAAHELKVPLQQRPMIHTYTSPWDSDAVVLLHVIGPYHSGQAFVMCVDLSLDLFHFEEIHSATHRFHRRHHAQLRTFGQACADFFLMSARHPDATKVHRTRMEWSVSESPLHVGSVPYETSFGQMLENARTFASRPELQQALLRGPIAMQRRTILNAIMHGAVMVQTRRKFPLAARRCLR
uniref:Outer capsid protein VP5 n=1 Tax=Kemerovo virus TaxID=40064 RepID=A0A5S9H6X3_9REOV|nr:outer capsid protein VP5 [Kemerovo virus]